MEAELKAKELQSFYENTFSVSRTMANIMAQNDIDIRLKTYLEVEREVMPKDGLTFAKWHEKVTYWNSVLKELLK